MKLTVIDASEVDAIAEFKRQLLSSIPVDFRTPLSLILGPLDDLIKDCRDDDQLALLRLMKRNATQLSLLVNEVAELSRLDGATTDVNLTYFHVNNFLRPIATEFSSAAEVRKIKFQFKDGTRDEFIKADQDKLRSAITNLLFYCLDRSRPGECITFSSSISGDASSKLLRIEIVMEPNAESNYSDPRLSVPGMGCLAVSLTKALLHLHDGKLLTDNAHGRYVMEIPTRSSKATTTAYPVVEKATESENAAIALTPDVTSVDRDTILIVEDNEDLRAYMASVLSAHFNVMTCANGEEGLQDAINKIPSLVLTDVMMPRLDGVGLLERLRSDERTSHIPVVMLTAKSEQQSKLQGYKLGADDYVTKPFSVEELVVRMTGLIEQRRQLADRFRERILVEPSPIHQPSLDEKFVMKVRDIVQRNIGNFNLTVEMVAEEMALSRTQLLRKLKALTGESPNDFIRNIRLKRAADMIANRVDTITQVGYAVGFNDQSYFTKSFKRHFGMTPSDFAAQARSAQQEGQN